MHGLPALELGSRIELLERPKLVERITADRPATLHERPALPPCDRFGREPRGESLEEPVGSRAVRVHASPEHEVLLRSLVDRGPNRVAPGRDVDADGQMQRSRVRRHRLMQPAAREVERVAGRIVTSITGSPGSPSSAEYFWFFSGSSRTGG